MVGGAFEGFELVMCKCFVRFQSSVVEARELQASQKVKVTENW